MAFLKNKDINLLNIHTGLNRFSTTIVLMFGALYFLEQGLSYQTIFLVWIIIFLIRLFFRPISLKLSQKIGLKRAVIFGVFFYSGVFPILTQINGMNLWLYIFIVYWAFADIFYWLPYHSYYAAMGESENRGKHIGIREAFTMTLGAIAPLTGGLLIDNFGFWALYAMSMIIILMGSIPLFFLPCIDPGEKMTYKKALKELDKRGFWLLLGEGTLYYSHVFIWTIVLYTLVNNFTTFGWLLSFEIFLNAILFLFLGHYIDKGKGEKITLIATILIAIVITGRALFAYSIPSILVFEVLFALSLCFYSSSLAAGFYNLSKKSHNTLWFHFFGEIGWDIGAITALLGSYFWVDFGFELRYFVFWGLLGLIIVNRVLNKYFKNNKILKTK